MSLPLKEYLQGRNSQRICWNTLTEMKEEAVTSALCALVFRTSRGRMWGTTWNPSTFQTTLSTLVEHAATTVRHISLCWNTNQCSTRIFRATDLVKYISCIVLVVSWCTTTATLLGGAWADSGSADPTKLYEYVGYDSESGKHICLKCSTFSHKSRSNARNHVEAVHFPALFTYSCQVCGQETGSKNALNIHMTRFHKTRHVALPPLWMPCCLRWSGDFDGWDWGGDNVSCLSQSSGLQAWCKTAYKAQARTLWKDCCVWTLWERVETPLGTWGSHEKSAWALFKEDCWSKWSIVLTYLVITGYVESFLEVFQEDLGTRIVCIECKKTFTNRQNARRHVRSIHSETGECFCSICNVSLTNIRTFNDHMRERHNVYKKGKYNMPQSNTGFDPLNWKLEIKWLETNLAFVFNDSPSSSGIVFPGATGRIFGCQYSGTKWGASQMCALWLLLSEAE